MVKEKEKITSLTKEINIEVVNFIDFLKNNLPKLEKSSFSIGKEAYNIMLKKEFLLDYNDETLWKYGWEEFNNTIQKMDVLAKEIDPNKTTKELLIEIKNEYPALGGEYEVQHHSEILEELINDGKIQIKKSKEKITYHDSCYLGRANNIYSAPRKVIDSLKSDLIEMKRNKQNGLCCGAGGAQMFKEAEDGKKSINIERIEEAIDSGATTIASACPFCLTMMSDGIKEKNQEENIKTKDIVEILAENIKSKKQN